MSGQWITYSSNSSSTIDHVNWVPAGPSVTFAPPVETKFEPATYFDDSPLAWLDRRVKEITDLVAA